MVFALIRLPSIQMTFVRCIFIECWGICSVYTIIFHACMKFCITRYVQCNKPWRQYTKSSPHSVHHSVLQINVLCGAYKNQIWKKTLNWTLTHDVRMGEKGYENFIATIIIVLCNSDWVICQQNYLNFIRFFFMEHEKHTSLQN